MHKSDTIICKCDVSLFPGFAESAQEFLSMFPTLAKSLPRGSLSQTLKH